MLTMSASLESTLTSLCTELEIPVPAQEANSRYVLQVGELVLRVAPWGDRQVILEGLIMSLADSASEHWKTQQEFLQQVLTWNLARLKGQARPEVMSIDQGENLLVLWRTWPDDERLTPALLLGAEQMLNEIEFWRSKISMFSPTLIRL
jgi:hypothetical protein